MIFKPELVEKILTGRKTVTRRPVKTTANGVGKATVQTPLNLLAPCRYEPGKDYALQPGRGKKAVARIRVLSVRRQRLGIGFDGGFEEARREGFSSWNAFADYWIALYDSYDSEQLVDRIEFELVRDTEGD